MPATHPSCPLGSDSMPISSRTFEWSPSAPISRSKSPTGSPFTTSSTSVPSIETGELRVEAKGHTLRDGGLVEDAGQIRPIHPQRSRIVRASGLRFGQGHDDRSARPRRPDDKTLGRIPLLEHLGPDAELSRARRALPCNVIPEPNAVSSGFFSKTCTSTPSLASCIAAAIAATPQPAIATFFTAAIAVSLLKILIDLTLNF